MINRISAILVLASSDEDEVLGKIHTLELFEDELFFTIVLLLILKGHTGLQLEHIELFLAFEIDVDHGIDPKGLRFG